MSRNQNKFCQGLMEHFKEELLRTMCFSYVYCNSIPVKVTTSINGDAFSSDGNLFLLMKCSSLPSVRGELRKEPVR